MLALHRDKRDLAASVLDGSEAAGSLGTEDLIALIRAAGAEAGGAADETDEEGDATDETPSEKAPSSSVQNQTPAPKGPPPAMVLMTGSATRPRTSTRW